MMPRVQITIRIQMLTVEDHESSNSQFTFQSTGFNAVDWILTKSSPGPGLGIGRVPTNNGSLALGRSNAFCDIVSGYFSLVGVL